MATDTSQEKKKDSGSAEKAPRKEEAPERAISSETTDRWPPTEPACSGRLLPVQHLASPPGKQDALLLPKDASRPRLLLTCGEPERAGSPQETRTALAAPTKLLTEALRS